MSSFDDEIVSSLSDKHKEVQLWLQKVFGDTDVPQYEINEMTIILLYSLMKINKERDHDIQLYIEDCKEKIEEYKAETIRIGKILSSLNVMPSTLCTQAQLYLRTISNAAITLDLKDTTETSFLLGFSDFEQQRNKVAAAKAAEQKLKICLQNKTLSSLQKAKSLSKALASQEEHASSQQSDLEYRTKQTAFLNGKLREYQLNLQHAQEHVLHSDFNESLQHSMLTKQAEELFQLKEKIVPLKSKLDSYQHLPPDIYLTKVKIEEAKQELAALEQEVTKKIDVMHM